MTASSPHLEPSPPPPRSNVWLLGFCFFLSGATALVYEVVWLRMLGLVFGHTVHAITTVLAAFMAGLALGGILLGRRVASMPNLIRTYGWLEIGIAVSCAAVPGLLWLFGPLYLWLHRLLEPLPAALGLVQFLMLFLILLVPTTLMGGTLPVLSQALARRGSSAGRTIGGLYAANTFGAVLGVAVAGYALLPALGNRLTVAVGVAGNLAIGIVALVYGASARGTTAERVPDPVLGLPVVDPEAVDDEPLAPGWAIRATIVALGISGAVSMLYEVAWSRALALAIGSSTYAFTAMLVAFLVGIAGGSAIYSWLRGNRRVRMAEFALIQGLIGIAATLSLLALGLVPGLFLLGFSWSDAPRFVETVQVGVSVAAMLLPTLLIGATFPCAVSVVAPDPARTGREVGTVYAVNTAGAIAGTVLAGFVLIPALGAHAAAKVGIVVNLLVAATLLAAAPGRARAPRWGAGAAAIVLAIGVWALPPWDPRVMTSGAAIYAKSYLRAASHGGLTAGPRLPGTQQVVYYRDGASATVSVHREGSNVFLRINGKTDASTAEDMPTQLMLGHLPLLVHPEPKEVAVIGLGSGVTVAAVARYPVTRVDVVEIEPAVVEAVRFFSEVNDDVLRDPRVRTVFADGRTFLLTSSPRFDVIVSEPSNPWIGGVASLFSEEFFRLARERLRPGGVMLQWLQAYGLSPDDLRMVVRTFRSAFPATTVWTMGRGDFLLLGAAAPVAVDLRRLKGFDRLSPGMTRDLDRLGVGQWAGVLGFYLLSEVETERLAGMGPLNTDDRLSLEFSAPRALHLDTGVANLRMVQSHGSGGLPAVTPESRPELDAAETRYWIGKGAQQRHDVLSALGHFRRALELDPGHTPSLIEASAIHLARGDGEEALRLARKAVEREPESVTPLVLAGLASSRVNAPAEALAFFQRAAAVDPQNARVRRLLTQAQLAELRGHALPVTGDPLAELRGR
ncbi:MAG TPA: fused MFS/spermidine synthase [Methylomirabilota bacterium]|nr:fused MFS/spermidine synthase [Methylomirabilota bacterium]